jgi:alpha-L-arabinofuranosidase
MIGAYLQHPQVDHAQIWNTRWIYQDRPDLWNALDANNGLLASGRALAIWGQFLQGTMVQSSNAPYIRTFASVDPASGKLSIFLINKDTSAQRTTVALANYPAAASGERWQMTGTDPDDKAPTWGRVSTMALQSGTLNLTLEPNSITVLTLAP